MACSASSSQGSWALHIAAQVSESERPEDQGRQAGPLLT